jgi:hypothetical protein
MRQRCLRISIGLVAVGLAWWWVPGWVGYVNYLRVVPEMSQRQVEHILGGPGIELEINHVTRVVDFNVPLDSPNRQKPVIDGDQYFRW